MKIEQQILELEAQIGRAYLALERIDAERNGAINIINQLNQRLQFLRQANVTPFSSEPEKSEL